MTLYTVRDTATMQPRLAVDSLDGAVGALETERTAFLLNRPHGVAVLELVITADDHSDHVGDVVVRYAAST